MGAHTGLSDVGAVMMTECMTIAGWIADSVSIPVIIDSGTGHGRIMAVRRMVRESSVPASPRCASTTGPKHACDADRKGECRIAAPAPMGRSPGSGRTHLGHFVELRNSLGRQRPFRTWSD